MTYAQLLHQLRNYPTTYFHNLKLPWIRWKYAADRARINPILAKLCVFGIRYGWHAGIIKSADPLSAPSNHPIPDEVKPRVVKDILHGLHSGFILGPFSKSNPWGRETVIAPIGTVRKKGADKYRVIQDLSYNKRIRRSVNIFIPAHASFVQYISFRRIVRWIRSLGRGSFIWVIDMAEAYRRVLLHHQFHRFLGFKWNNMIFRYACLPFGLSSSPQIYSAFAECLRQIVLCSHTNLFFINGAPVLFNYLDDFFCGHPCYKKSLAQYRLFREWLVYLGVPTQEWKCCAPATLAIILGFLYNTIDQTVAIPGPKLKEIINQIKVLLAKRRVSRRELAAVSGKLNWCCQIVFGGRAMVRSLELLTCIPRAWDAKVIRITSEAKKDLNWWKNILSSPFVSIPLEWLDKDASDADIHVWSDASGNAQLGFGAYCSLGHYFHIRWADIQLPQAFNWNDINFPEFFALVVAVYLWAPLFAGKSVHFHCDNSAVVSMVIKRSITKDRADLLSLARWLTQIALAHRFYFWITYIPGVLNIEADNLSRFKVNPFERLYSCLDGAQIDKHSKPFFNFNKNFDSSFDWKQDSALVIANRILQKDPLLEIQPQLLTGS